MSKPCMGFEVMRRCKICHSTTHKMRRVGSTVLGSYYICKNRNSCDRRCGSRDIITTPDGPSWSMDSNPCRCSGCFCWLRHPQGKGRQRTGGRCTRCRREHKPTWDQIPKRGFYYTVLRPAIEAMSRPDRGESQMRQLKPLIGSDDYMDLVVAEDGEEFTRVIEHHVEKYGGKR